MTALLVTLAGAVGAVVRYLVGRRLDGGWPLGTLLVNLVGSLVLGGLVGAGASTEVLAVLGVGFCGGLTTYSAFAVQSVEQSAQGGPLRGAAYVALTILGCLLAAALGCVASAAWLAS